MYEGVGLYLRVKYRNCNSQGCCIKGTNSLYLSPHQTDGSFNQLNAIYPDNTVNTLVFGQIWFTKLQVDQGIKLSISPYLFCMNWAKYALHLTRLGRLTQMSGLDKVKEYITSPSRQCLV